MATAATAADDVRVERLRFYEEIDALEMTPLWEVLDALVTPRPVTPCVPHLWSYETVRPFLARAGTLISAKEAVRRVLVLENPGLRGQSCTTHSLYAGLQLILPGEVAPAHRHTQSALRFVVEGRGAYTAVDGERRTMEPGDFIITPSWTWHDHGNAGSDPVVWLDGLDIPLVRMLDASFAEGHPDEAQKETTAEGTSLARFGNNMAPLDYAPASKTSPVFAYPYVRARETLETLRRAGDPDPCHGWKMQYINPVTGGYAMPTIAAFLQLLPAGLETAPYRATDGTVVSVVEGRGTALIGDGEAARSFAFGPCDHFVVPSWTSCRLAAAQDAVLFSFSDRPVQKALGLWREDRGGA